MPSYDILVASIEHRTELLKSLLEVLVPQVVAGVGIIVYRDNLEASIGDKRQRLVEASKADYVSFIDDDDSVPDYFVARVLEALTSEPDYVGWQQRYTKDGVEQLPVLHSLEHIGEWQHDDKAFYRGITHFNQIRRELALLVRYEGDGGEDHRWGQALERTGKVRTEVYIDEVMHFHDESSTDGFAAPRVPLTVHPKAPKFAGVRYVTGAPRRKYVSGPSIAMERMWWRDRGPLGVYSLAYRKGMQIPAAELPLLISDTELANVQ